MAVSWQKMGFSPSGNDLDQAGDEKNIATKQKCLHFYKTATKQMLVYCFSSIRHLGMIPRKTPIGAGFGSARPPAKFGIQRL
jgi:hypothetical protein